VQQYGLPPQPGKAADSRAGAFVARHGQVVQVELEALDPTDLRALYQAAIDRYLDTSIYDGMVAAEEDDQAELEELSQRFRADDEADDEAPER
jgi:hypothetical protein